jgi:ATP-binding cassette subfamily C (CFTR/MRP) protein 1
MLFQHFRCTTTHRDHQIVIGVALLINNVSINMSAQGFGVINTNTYQLGYSALVGLGVLIIGFPIQFLLVLVVFKQRKKTVAVTDQRVRIINEVRLAYYYCRDPVFSRTRTDLARHQVRRLDDLNR